MRRNLPLWVSLPMHWPKCTSLFLATCMELPVNIFQSIHTCCSKPEALQLTFVALRMMLALTYSTLFW